MIFLRVFLLLGCISFAFSSEFPLNKTVEIDLVFPQNETYTLTVPFPIIFIIQQARLAYGFGFTFTWNITGRGSSAYMYYDSSTLFSFWERETPPDTYILVNSTLSQDPIPQDQFVLPAGQWTLGWSYGSQECLPVGSDTEEFTSGGWGGSIDFTTVDEGSGGTPPDLTVCPIVALEVPYVGNWSTNCPAIGNPTTSYAAACGIKLDEVQASSISAELAISTASATGSATVFSTGATETGSSPTGGSSASATPTHTNVAGKEQLGSVLLSVAAGFAGVGAALL